MANQPKDSSQDGHKRGRQSNPERSQGLQPRQMSRRMGRSMNRFEPSVESKASDNSSLDGTVQAKMENAFQEDFSDVQVTKDSDQATKMGAQAFTQGDKIHFAPGNYKPHTSEGQELIGHELAHVVQQKQGRVKATTQAKGAPLNGDPALESEADAMGKKVASGKQVVEVQKSENGVVQRQESQGNRKETWEGLNYQIKENLKLWISEQIDAIQDVGIVFGLEKKNESSIKIPTFFSLLLRYIPAVSPHVSLGTYVIETMANNFISFVGSSDRVNFSDFFVNYREAQTKFRRMLMDNKIHFSDFYIENGYDENDIPQLLSSLNGSISSFLPTAIEAKRSFITSWVSSATDIDASLPQWLQVESDLRAGSRAGYIYLRVKRAVLPGGNVNYSNWEGPFLDDIDFPEGTNQVLQEVYGQNTKITELPFEIQLQIDSITPAGTRLVNPNESRTLAIKRKTTSSELEANQVFETIYGMTSIMNDWLGSGMVPELKDLVTD